MIFYDLDRLVRQPRDLEDLIDIVEYVQRPAVGATGGRMNLINDNDRHMARMMCAMALKSSEDSSRRVARMHLAAAQQGKIQGRIAYGWIRTGPDKGKILEPEAAVVREIFAACLFGQTAYSIATDLNRGGIPSPTGRSWSSTMVNKILRNPRYAGMVSYGGKHRVDPTLDWDGWSRVLFDDDGHPLLGSWERVIDPRQWSQVQFELQLRRQRQVSPRVPISRPCRRSTCCPASCAAANAGVAWSATTPGRRTAATTAARPRRTAAAAARASARNRWKRQSRKP